jgi:ribonuclease Z
MFHKDPLWDFSRPLPNTNLTLKGHSRGSEKSCFYISEVGLYFDAGITPFKYAKSIFITHGHHDHSEELPKFASGFNLVGKSYPIIGVPAEAAKQFQNFIDASFRLCQHTDKSGHIKVLPCKPGDTIDLKDKGYFVEVFDLIHGNMPTRAYGLCQSKKKLNPKYVGLPKDELIKIKKTVEDFNITVLDKLVVYVCDTCIEGWHLNPQFTEYKNVLVECTFLGEHVGHPDTHITWTELKPIVYKHPQVHFTLIHFSARYSDAFISEYFEGENLPDNVYLWMN